jgi:phospholipase/carboxylesterase
MTRLKLYYQIAPSKSTSPGPHPVIFLLHGRGADETDLLDVTSHFNSRFICISVRAPFRFPYGGYTWFDLEPSGTFNIDQLLESQEAFFQFLDTLPFDGGFNRSRVFLLGFSMGAMMAFSLALQQPDRFKGIIAHSGLLPKHDRLQYQWDRLNGISFFIAHGTYDPVVQVNFSREAQRQLAEKKASVEYREYPIQHSMSEESLIDISTWIHRQL